VKFAKGFRQTFSIDFFRTDLHVIPRQENIFPLLLQVWAFTHYHTDFVLHWQQRTENMMQIVSVRTRSHHSKFWEGNLFSCESSKCDCICRNKLFVPKCKQCYNIWWWPGRFCLACWPFTDSTSYWYLFIKKLFQCLHNVHGFCFWDQIFWRVCQNSKVFQNRILPI